LVEGLAGQIVAVALGDVGPDQAIAETPGPAGARRHVLNVHHQDVSQDTEEIDGIEIGARRVGTAAPLVEPILEEPPDLLVRDRDLEVAVHRAHQDAHPLGPMRRLGAGDATPISAASGGKKREPTSLAPRWGPASGRALTLSPSDP